MKAPGIQEVARALLTARRDNVLCDAVALAGALHDPADAFAVQGIVLKRMLPPHAGFPRHWKSGGTGPGGVPSHAPLPPDGVWPSPAEAGAWPCRLRLIEAEIALCVARDVTPAQAAGLDTVGAPALVDAMAVAIELVESRWRQGMAAPVLLKLADLQSHGALVLGEWRPFESRNWAEQRCTVRIGTKPLEERRGTHALGDPTAVLPPLLRHMTRDGSTVPRGTVITSGTWCGVLPAAAGDLVVVSFDGIGTASLQL